MAAVIRRRAWSRASGARDEDGDAVDAPSGQLEQPDVHVGVREPRVEPRGVCTEASAGHVPRRHNVFQVGP